MPHLDKFRVDDLQVSNSRYWIVAVRAKQITAGDLVILPIVEYPSFADVPSDAAVELFEILARLESLALTELGADRINVVAAMMKDPFVHFHFFPRYEGTTDAFEMEWTDSDWPRAITLRDVDTSESTLARVRQFYADRLAGA